MRTVWIHTIGVIALSIGCEQAPPATAPRSTEESGPPPPPSVSRANEARSPDNDSKAEQQPVYENVMREEARAGVGKKGRGYGGGIITEPIRQRFLIQDRLILGQVKHAINLYKAQDPRNKGPRSQEEFMEKIIQANNLRLPELPRGERYVYDPETEKLMVERPRK